MKFVPVNRHIQIEIIEKEDNDGTVILMPQGYQKTEETYQMVNVLSVSKRLIDENQMGQLFKVMCITKNKSKFKLGF